MTKKIKAKNNQLGNQNSQQDQLPARINNGIKSYLVLQGAKRVLLVTLGYALVGALLGALVWSYGWRVLVVREDWHRLFSALADIVGIQIRWQNLVALAGQRKSDYFLSFAACSGLLGAFSGHVWVVQYRMLRSFFGSTMAYYHWTRSWVMAWCAAISSVMLLTLFLAFALPVIFGITLRLMVYTI